MHHGVEVVYAIPDIKDNLDNHEVGSGGARWAAAPLHADGEAPYSLIHIHSLTGGEPGHTHTGHTRGLTGTKRTYR